MNLLVYPKAVVESSFTLHHNCSIDGFGERSLTRRHLGHATVDISYQQGPSNRPSSIRDRTYQC